MLREGPKLLHWNYFLALESDLDRLSRFVEFTIANYETYSLEMALLLLAAGSEIDVVLKKLCKKVNPGESPKNITAYRKVLCPKLLGLPKMKIRIPRFGLDIVPWQNWQSDKNPDWWKAYNDVKHERDKYFSKANLKHTIAAIAGLFVASIYLYRHEAENGFLVPMATLLTPECIHTLKQTDFGISVIYQLS